MTHGRTRTGIRTVLVLIGLLGLSLAASTAAGAQQVPYDPSMTLLQLGTATCGPNGTVTASFTLPSQVTDDYQVIAAGIATLPTDKDVPYSVLATVTQDANGPISVTAPGCRPGTQVRFSVRYREAASPAPAAAASGLPRTGTDIVSTVLIGLTALSIGAALVVTAVNHRRRTRSA